MVDTRRLSSSSRLSNGAQAPDGLSVQVDERDDRARGEAFELTTDRFESSQVIIDGVLGPEDDRVVAPGDATRVPVPARQGAKTAEGRRQSRRRFS